MDAILTEVQALAILADYPPRFSRPPRLGTPRPKAANQCPMCGWAHGQRGFLAAPVPRDHPLFGRLIQCPVCWEGYLPKYLEKISGLSDEMLHWSLGEMMRGDGRQAAWSAAKRFTRRPKEPRGWLTVWGNYGVGKTYVLASVVNEFRRHQTAAIYVVVPDLLDRLRQAYEPDAPQAFNALFARVRDVPVLALDELGQVKMTEWAVEKLFLLLDYRYREAHCLATVIATHLEPDPATSHWPDRAAAILSRLHGPPGAAWPIVEMSGGDVRKL